MMKVKSILYGNVLVCFCITVLLLFSVAQAADMADSIQINSSGSFYNRLTCEFSFNTTLKNTSCDNFSAPIIAVISNLSSDQVTVSNPDGTDTSGNPYFDYSGFLGDDNTLSDSEVSGAKKWIFHNPRNVRFTYDIQIVSGAVGAADDVLPSISITNPVNNSVTTTAAPYITIEFGDDDSGINVESLAIQINGINSAGLFEVTDTRASYQVATPLPSSSNVISAYISDNAGNTSAVDSCFTVNSGTEPNQFKNYVKIYNRDLYEPFKKFNFYTVQEMVNKIRSEGHPIPTGHPRIFINNHNKDYLRQKIEKYYSNWMQEAVDLAYKEFDSVISHPGGHSKEPAAQPVVLACGMIYQLGEIKGIDYHGKSVREYGEAGVRHLQDLANIGPAPYGSNYQHAAYLGLPLGYDWLYEIMNDTDRKMVASRLLLDARPEDTTINSWNHPPGARLLGALAVRGDDFGDDFNETEADRLLDMFYNGMVFGDPRDIDPILEHGQNMHYHHIFLPEGPGKEGYGYSVRYNAFYPLLEAWYDQTGEDYFKMPFFQNWVFHATHIVGNEYEHKDKYTSLKDESWLRSIGLGVVITLEVGLSRSNPEAASLAKYNQLMKYIGLSGRLIYMLRADPSIIAKSPAELNLSKTAHFKIVNNIFMRSSWEGVDATWVWFQSPAWGNHIRNLGPVNDFNIWKNGGFLLPKRTQRHDYDGGSRVNTFVLYDENEPNKTFIQNNVMDRAANRPGVGGGLKDLSTDLSGYTKGLKYFEHHDGEYSYMLGDGAKSFRDQRLKNWSRQFIWFRTDNNELTDHFVVFDRIEKKNDGIKEHMMLNFNKNPVIKTRTSDADSGEGEKLMNGIWKYGNSNRIVASNDVKTGWGTAHGRVFVDTLLPENPVYYRMGGIGTRNIDLFGDLRQKKIPASLINGDPNDPENIIAGMWRVQITAKSNKTRQVYLHTLQADNIFVEEPKPTVLIKGDNIVGACSGKNIALFNKQESELETGNATLPEGINGFYRLLITDLTPMQTYSVSIDGRLTNNENMAASKAGTLFFNKIFLIEGQQIKIVKKLSGTSR